MPDDERRTDTGTATEESTGLDLEQLGADIKAQAETERPVDDSASAGRDTRGEPDGGAGAPETGGEGSEAVEAASQPTDTGTGSFEPTEAHIQAAKQIGYSDDEIEQIATQAEADGVLRAARAHSRKMAELGRKSAESGDTAAAASPSDAEQTQPEPGGEDRQGDEIDVDSIPEFNDDDLAVGEGADALNQMRKLLMQQSKQIQQLTGQMVRDEAESSGATAEKFFGELAENPAYADVFGTGASSELDESSNEYKARDNVRLTAKRLQRGFESVGDSITEGEALKQALLAEYFETVQEANKRDAAKVVADRRDQHTARPSGRRGTSQVEPAETETEGAKKINQALQQRYGSG